MFGTANTAKDRGEKFYYAIFGELRPLDFYGRLIISANENKAKHKGYPQVEMANSSVVYEKKGLIREHMIHIQIKKDRYT